MRPVKLEMHGFAGFRDRTEVDFAEADYFAFVGPTGSGKSTVLDAITFALYGSAPRWKDQKVTHMALAPTTNRCVLSLVFDIGNERYRVARELRRTPSSITQKVSLVRYADATLVEVGPEDLQPEVLAGEVRALDKLVPDLLGLSFADFCQCVVLPQGEFATFLGADSSKRHETLIKLLGGERYGEIAKLAGAKAKRAGAEIDVLTEQLGTYTDATPEAEAAARGEAEKLADLSVEVAAVAADIITSRAEVKAAETTAAAHTNNLAALRAIEVPDGVTELQAAAAGAKAALSTARVAAEQTAKTWKAATEAARIGPRRAALDQAGERHTEKAKLLAAQEATAAAATGTAADRAASESALEEAEAVLVAAATAAAQAKDALVEATSEHSVTNALAKQVASVKTPDGLSDVAARAADAGTSVQAAQAAVDVARAETTKAETEAAALPTPAWFEQARAEIQQVDRVHEQLGAAQMTLAVLEASQADLDSAVTEAQADVAAAQQALDAAAVDAGAALLRSQLEAGHSCPVCEQLVETVPAAHPHDQTTARAVLEKAQKTLSAAGAASQQGLLARTKAQSELQSLLDRSAEAEARLAAKLPDRAVGDARDLGGDMAHVEDLAQRQVAAGAATAAARKDLVAHELALAAAVKSTAAVEGDLAKFRADLHTKLGALSQLDPPSVDTADLAAGWAALVTWAEGQSADLARRVEESGIRVGELTMGLAGSTTALTAATVNRKAAQDASNAAILAAGAAARALTDLTDRLAELTSLLAGAPAAAELPALLEECSRLDAAVTAAGEQVDSANGAVTVAAEQHEVWDVKVSVARSVLGAARDSVAVLAPPVLSDSDLAAAWEDLTSWVATNVESQGAGLEAAASAASRARDTAAAGELRVTTLLAEHGLSDAVSADADVAAAAPQAVAIAGERAKARVDEIAKSLAQLAGLQSKIASASEEQKVAQQLATLLRKDRFPEWLAASALDVLVAGASETLRELSGNQFDLTHEDGDFFVIDHADADSVRSVRTLSGGETFQASLALALALAEQLRGLGSAARLESIFLDEGFGTLDPDALEVVAGTLENLAHGERMVGVITHVAALAERVPVRFQVSNDSRTSTVTREG